MSDLMFIIEDCLEEDTHDLVLSRFGNMVAVSTNSRETCMGMHMLSELKLAIIAIELGFEKAMTRTGLRILHEREKLEERMKQDAQPLQASSPLFDIVNSLVPKLRR